MRYETKILDRETLPVLTDRASMEGFMNELGREGWHLVQQWSTRQIDGATGQSNLSIDVMWLEREVPETVVPAPFERAFAVNTASGKRAVSLRASPGTTAVSLRASPGTTGGFTDQGVFDLMRGSV